MIKLFLGTFHLIYTIILHIMYSCPKIVYLVRRVRIVHTTVTLCTRWGIVLTNKFVYFTPTGDRNCSSNIRLHIQKLNYKQIAVIIREIKKIEIIGKKDNKSIFSKKKKIKFLQKKKSNVSTTGSNRTTFSSDTR